MGMHSSWNSDRVVAAFIARKPATSRRPQKRSGVKLSKASDLYIREYGEEAYNAWKCRESEIDALMLSGNYRKYEIIRLREDNLRQMKAEGVSFLRQGIVPQGTATRPYAPAAQRRCA